MEEKNRNDLKISGVGSTSGGYFNEVKISGAASVNGDIDCIIFHASGACNMNGNVVSKEVKISGACDVKGYIKAEKLNVSGTANINDNVQVDEINISGGSEIRGSVKGKNIKISGGCKVKGDLNGDEIELSGGIKIGNNCECEKFKARGGFDIGGLLNAGDINVCIYGECYAKEIGGENISIKYSNDVAYSILKVIKSMFTIKNTLITEVIEGDNIYLEGTAAKIIRGNNVTIGEDCIIDKVEFKGELKIIDNAVVKEQIKIE